MLRFWIQDAKQHQQGSKKNKKATQKKESQKAVLIDGMKSVGEIASKIWSVFLVFYPFSFLKISPWPMTLNFGQGHRHLGH